MYKSTLLILFFFISCTSTQPVETHDDTSVLQDFIDSSILTLNMSYDVDNSGTIEPLELGIQEWENGRITILNCYNIGLSGSIPESIGEMTELRQLSLKNNSLNGEIPESIGNLNKLTQLNLSANTLSGSIPDTIGNLKSLTRLDVSNNKFTGSIPISIGNLVVMHTFIAHSNNFSTIPNEICNIYNTDSDYNLSGNQFCQSLPNCFDTRDQIGYQNCDTSCGIEYKFNDGYCYFQSDLDILQKMIDDSDSLNMSLDTNYNAIIEPYELGIQKWSAGRLETLDCNQDTINCNLSISLLVNMSNLDSLKVLDLEKNSMQGNLDESLGNISNLITLNIRDNQFSGYLPENICNINSVLLQDNQFCPCYPDCIIEIDSDFKSTQDISACSYCNEGYTQICDKRPETVKIMEGDSLCYKSDNLDVLVAFIDSSLSNLPDSLDVNMLSDNTATIHELKHLELGNQTWTNGKLMTLETRYRGLSGGIPQNIGNLDTLMLLILSNNYLTGQLPASIYTLENLWSLNISDNQFDGEISQTICNLNLTWELEGSLESKSYLFENKICPGEIGYPECIAPYVGEQDTIGCITEE